MLNKLESANLNILLEKNIKQHEDSARSCSERNPLHSLE